MRRLLVLSLIAILLAGCSGRTNRGGGETDWSFADADERISGTTGGTEDRERPFTVPRNTTKLVIKASYSLGGNGVVEVVEPSGTSHSKEDFNGGAFAQDDRWFEQTNPAPGRWSIRMQVNGGAQYSFGIYYTIGPTGGGEGTEGSGAPETRRGPSADTVALASAGSVLLLGALALSNEFGRYKFLSLLGALGLFSRLEKDEVLAHEKREQVYQYIKDNPGPSFSDLRRDLELSNGTLVHHLRVLESQEFVRAYRDGFRTRFYLRGPKIVPTAYLTRTQQQLLDTISANPGVTQKDLTKLLGLPRESVSYHAKRLAAQGQLQIRQEGKWRRYWTVGAASPGAVPRTAP